MVISRTKAGTPVVDLTEEEHDACLQDEVRRLTGMTAADFVRLYLVGALDDSDPAVSELVGLF